MSHFGLLCPAASGERSGLAALLLQDGLQALLAAEGDAGAEPGTAA